MSIIGALGVHPHLLAQQVSSSAPPQSSIAPAAQPVTTPQAQSLPDLSTIPQATPLPPEKAPQKIVWEADTQSQHGSVYLLAGNVIVTYGDHTLSADTIRYDSDTDEIEAQGHLRLSGGENDEYLAASHGTYNLKTGTGRFYDVTGSVGLHATNRMSGAPEHGGLVSPNPFLFSGRLVVKTGPRNYEIYDGTVTSCLLPHPDWQLSAGHLSMDQDKVRAKDSTFRLLRVPILFLPYVTHPVDSEQRQSGLLIPILSHSSTKGYVIGEDAYLTLGRSADLTAGLQYFSARGFSESSTFRYRGLGDNFFDAHFSALQDRGYIDPSTLLYVNQGGEDVTAGFRRQIAANTRAVADVEYLSSYVYREAFTNNFNQAVSSDITSIGYITRQDDGYSLDVRADRYQGLKLVPIGTQPGEEVRIFHAPSLDVTAMDHRIGGTPFFWDLTGSSAALKRSQPNFVSSGMIERFDLRPELDLPLSGGGWHTMSSIAVRETWYSRSRETPYTASASPIELTQPINRASVEMKVQILPPAIERTFTVPASLQKFFGTEVRHTVEPEITWRNTHGIDNFLSILRFDDNDLDSDTDELEYGVTQHLYFRPRIKPAKPKPGCPAASASEASASRANGLAGEPAAPLFGPPAESIPNVLDPDTQTGTDANGIPNVSATASDAPLRTYPRHADQCAPQPATSTEHEWFSWRLAQRHFFDPTFGGAVIDSRRNIFDSTLSLSGIAFLTEPRSISPLISRMRFRSSAHTDAEWDFDLDTGAKKFTSSNIFLDAHTGSVFGGVSYARLNAPGRFYTEDLGSTALIGSPTSNFSQMRVLLGYGTPTKPGLSLAGNAGFDLRLDSLQYASVQANYNWNCCGLTVEYRKYELGSVRNEGVERFSFTLANIGGAGNLRRSERLF
ncbi:MAG TPA: LPS assembly protein LptD [Acidobacteriaceae bacterium]|nr:LPS assembly protein LptD [Acidobacteriaceae bacterium]